MSRSKKKAKKKRKSGEEGARIIAKAIGQASILIVSELRDCFGFEAKGK